MVGSRHLWTDKPSLPSDARSWKKRRQEEERANLFLEPQIQSLHPLVCRRAAGQLHTLIMRRDPSCRILAGPLWGSTSDTRQHRACRPWRFRWKTRKQDRSCETYREPEEASHTNRDTCRRTGFISSGYSMGKKCEASSE